MVDLLLTGMFRVFKSVVFEHRKNHTFFFDQLYVQRQIEVSFPIQCKINVALWHFQNIAFRLNFRFNKSIHEMLESGSDNGMSLGHEYRVQ